MFFFILNDWVTAQLDMVLACPHAKVDRPTFMDLPKGFRFEGHNENWALQLLKSNTLVTALRTR